MFFAVIGVVLLGILWGLIVSRGFRIFAVLLAAVGLFWGMAESDKAARRDAEEKSAVAARQATENARQVERWSRVLPDRIELRDPKLIPAQYSVSGGRDFTYTASIKNLSNTQLGGFEIEITAKDCSVTCEVIGHSIETAWGDIPPQQVRGISGKLTFINLPEVRGKFTPQFEIKRVYAGDILDAYTAPK
jgi:hypothetical protein